MGQKIVGGIPAIEADPAHLQFVRVAKPPTVILDLNETRRLSNHEDKHLDFGDGTTVITTSTVADTDMVRWERELELIDEIQPTVHIPTDGPVYADDDPDERVGGTLDCLEGTVWMHDQLQRQPTTILPLIKGTQPSERQLCYRVIDRLGVEQCAFYASQYFAGGVGTNQLLQDLATITDETDTDLVVLGLLSPTYLRRLPRSVIAATGLNAWRQAVIPNEATDRELCERYAQFNADVEDALGVRQATPSKTEAG